MFGPCCKMDIYRGLFEFAIISQRYRELVIFSLFVVLLPCGCLCFEFIPRGTMGWPVIYNMAFPSHTHLPFKTEYEFTFLDLVE